MMRTMEHRSYQFLIHAVGALRRARMMPRGDERNRARAVARILHRIVKSGDYPTNVVFLDRHRAARKTGQRLKVWRG